LARLLLGGLLIVAAELHLAEDALALHLLLQRLESLVDVVVADKNLHASFPLLWPGCPPDRDPIRLWMCRSPPIRRQNGGRAGSPRPAHRKRGGRRGLPWRGGYSNTPQNPPPQRQTPRRPPAGWFFGRRARDPPPPAAAAEPPPIGATDQPKLVAIVGIGVVG